MSQKILRSALCFFAALVLSVPSAALLAQSDQGLASRWFGLGQPARVDDLPPGQLKRRLESLPPQASARALRWLQDAEFPGTDLDLLRVDDEGGVYFADSLQQGGGQAAQAESAAVEAAPQGTLDDAFRLHSKPGAPNTVYLDFDGHVIAGTAWNANFGVSTFYARAYDLDGDPATFNATERARIADIWHRVAEDLAPFDIDVTTEEPAVFDRFTGRVLVTGSHDEYSTELPHGSGAGGVAYLGVFGLSNYHSYYSPALVYYDNLGSGEASYVAEASSHEFGHNLNLSHDGTTGGTAYYAGLGSGLVSWAPIMGNSYYNNVTQWSRGEYPNANNLQDDVAIIQNQLGLRGDDHGDVIGAGSALLVGGDGSVVSSNPELDPHNELPENKGVIDGAGDVDVFTFTAGAGTLNLTLTPAWDAFYRGTSRRGANLDIQAQLRNAAGSPVASSEPTSDTMATLAVTVAAGTYHLLISGVGNAAVPYSDYASLGQYFINGSMAVGSADTTAPTPNPMTWATPPAALSDTEIGMTAAMAADESGSVQYRFSCVSGGPNCSSSNWQDSRSWTASGLTGDTQYTFTVAARDASGNQTAASAPASATTDAPPPPPPYVDFVAAGETPVAGSVSGNYANTHSNDGAAQAIREIESGGKPSSRHSYLEHRWAFSIGSGATATVYANAWSGGSGDGDAFRFEYSLDGGSSWQTLFTVAATSPANMQAFQLPGSPSGALLLRVIDSNRAAGARELNTVYVDQLLIQVANPPSDPPDADPSAMSATAVSASRIDLAWTDNAGNESSYRVERSPDGNGGWSLLAELPADSQFFADSGLAPGTSYWYRVSAYNLNGSSAFAYASATTHLAPPPPALSLQASGYKVKGVQHADLSWLGATSVDVYRNGARIASAVAGSAYTDNIGSKGGGSYQYQVCVAGGSSSCSNVSTVTL